jgi:hypothetical protein
MPLIGGRALGIQNGSVLCAVEGMAAVPLCEPKCCPMPLHSLTNKLLTHSINR